MSGIDRIAAERKRQIAQEGWTPEHDDEHTDASLAIAGGCYAVFSEERIENPPGFWPDSWDESWWKPSSDPIRNLEKAGALIAAEIDRLERAKIIASTPALPKGWGVSGCTDNELVIHLPEGGGVVAQKNGDTVATQVLFDLVTALISGTAKREGDGE